MSDVVAYSGKFRITKNDIAYAHHRHDYERDFIGVGEPIDRQMVFSTITYSMLSAAQNTPRLIKVYDKIRRRKMNIPENIKKSSDGDIEALLKGTRFPKVKMERFKKLPEWWEKKESQDVVDYVVEKINSNDVSKQKCMRHMLSVNGPLGVSHKTSSLIVQTLTKDLKDVDVVTVDKWILDVLKRMGHTINGRNIKVPDYRTVPGITKKEYIECERIISEDAERFGLSPGELGYTLWCNLAYIKRDKGLFEHLNY